MKIVCLDGYTLNPGDLSWDCFEALGDLTVHDRSDNDEILNRSQGAPILLTNKTPITAETISELPDLKYIGVLATGYNVVDIAAAAERGVTVTNIPTYGTDTVAQHTVAMMLEMARGISAHNKAVHDGQWTSCKDFCFAVTPIVELTGKTLGVLGLGRIGIAVARIAAAMGMRIVTDEKYYFPNQNDMSGLEIEPLPADELFKQADVITLHCPLTSDTEHIINAERLSQMKKTATVINTSRGPLIDQHALAQALKDDVIAGAALDVLDVEPAQADNPLLGAPNCIITPHVAWYAREARDRLMRIAAENLKAFQSGKPVNTVKPR